MNKVAIEQDGVREVHAVGGYGDYATLCGMDGNDSDIQQMMSHRLALRTEKIDCAACKSIWELCKQFKRADFKR